MKPKPWVGGLVGLGIIFVALQVTPFSKETRLAGVVVAGRGNQVDIRLPNGKIITTPGKFTIEQEVEVKMRGDLLQSVRETQRNIQEEEKQEDQEEQ